VAIATPETYADMIDRAKAGKYAIPAINVTSSQTLSAALQGFADAESDGIIQVSNGGAAYWSGSSRADRAKRYPEALKIKQQYVDRCIRFNGYTARIRPYNDLAESQLHTGDKAACRSTLAQIEHWFEPEIPSTYLDDKTFRREQKRYEAAVKACAK